MIVTGGKRLGRWWRYGPCGVQLLMKKRGDSWLCVAELRARVGVPRYTSSARLSPRLQQRQDNARCNYICNFDEHVVRVDNMRRAFRLIRQTPAIRVFLDVTVMTSLGESSSRHADDTVCTLPLEALVIMCSQTIQPTCGLLRPTQ
jgi:hypothetical protein